MNIKELITELVNWRGDMDNTVYVAVFDKDGNQKLCPVEGLRIYADSDKIGGVRVPTIEVED